MSDELWQPITEKQRMTESTADRDVDWNDILDDPWVALILGRRGSGKSALGHRLLEVYHKEHDRDAYILGFPGDKRDLLPEWIEWLPEALPYDRWPENSITLVNEAHHVAHARRSMGAENLEVDKLVTISRQRDADIVFDTQYARRLDVTALMGSNAIIFRYPSLMAEDYERSELKKFVREARDALDQFVETTETDDYVLRDDGDELQRRAYVIAEKFRGLFPNPVQLPAHWSEDISKAYSGPGAEPVDESDPSEPSSRTPSGVVLSDTVTVIRPTQDGMARSPTKEEFADIQVAWEEAMTGGPAPILSEDDDDAAPTDTQAETSTADPAARAEIDRLFGDENVIVEVDEEKADRVVARTQSVQEKLQEEDADPRFIDQVINLPWDDDPHLKVYLRDEHHDDIHAIYADLIGTTPEQLYDHSKESDRSGFDRFYPWDLKRDEHGDPWQPSRWRAGDFIDRVEEEELGPVLIESGVHDLI